MDLIYASRDDWPCACVCPVTSPGPGLCLPRHLLHLGTLKSIEILFPHRIYLFIHLKGLVMQGMSSFTRQLAQSVPVAHFALGKYSQAITSIDHNGPVNWNHLHGNGDLSVVFEKHSLSASATSSGHETLYLKVIHGQRNLVWLPSLAFGKGFLTDSQYRRSWTSTTWLVRPRNKPCRGRRVA